MPTLFFKIAFRIISLVFFVLVGLGIYLIISRTASAQVPPPSDDCSTDEPEFHSLRPYQASPCHGGRDLAVYCGTDLVLQDKVKDYFSYGNPNCRQIGDGKYKCNFTESVVKNFAIDVSGVDFPIAGRTEDDVVNSQTQPSPEIDDAEKVNEYVSWYLNGVNNRAEYSFPYDITEEDLKKIINFSGPLNKLLPESIQKNERVATIENAVQKDLNADQVIGSVNIGGGTRHNQIIGCVYNLWGFTKLGKIVGCYPSSGDKKEIRLSDWENHLPPHEDDPQYKNFQEYYIAYRKWSGDSCMKILLPFIDPVYLCADNPLKPNYWANLFTRIPYSSTEDRKGSLEVTSAAVQPQSEDLEVTNVNVQSTPSDLFFAHQEENNDLAFLLQHTYVSKDNMNENSINYDFVDIQGADHCNLVEVRSNPGDDLFAGEIGVDVSYTVNYSCEFDIERQEPIQTTRCSDVLQKTCYSNSWLNCTGSVGRQDCPNYYICADSCEEPLPSLACEKTANIYLSTVTQTPGADSVWARLVAGATSVFKRWFPKMGEGGPVDAVLDIPAASKVKYSSSENLQAVNPAGRISQSPELYFPHLGGVQEYFLKAIQTALRPKGFGDPILSGKSSTSSNGNYELCEAPSTPPGSGGANKCELGVGYCSPDNLRRYFSSDRAAQQASIICNAESGGDPSSTNCDCLRGGTYDYSIGLFQINLLVHCDGAFHSTRNPTSCSVKNESKLNQCTDDWYDIEGNINKAVELSSGGTNWNPWSAYLLTNAEGGCKEQVDAVP